VSKEEPVPEKISLDFPLKKGIVSLYFLKPRSIVSKMYVTPRILRVKFYEAYLYKALKKI
jgi:hypothetical protein